jgi:membrane-bound lytic murein transglycosylase A
LRSACLAALLALAACATSGTDNTPRPVAYDQMPGWSTDATGQAFGQFRAVCDRLAVLPAATRLGGPPDHPVTVAAFVPACLAARQVLVSTAADARAFFEHWFAAYDAGREPFTGYVEPEFQGSLTEGGAYQTPVLARPADLVTVPSPDGHGTVSGRAEHGVIVPYATRAEIDGGALRGRGLEIVWLADPVDLVFLQLQGQGRIRLPSGQVVRVDYAGKNGRPYVPLGRLMVERNLLAADDISPASIRNWLEAHPADARSLIEQNPNYVFFRALEGVPLAEGAPGSLGVPLTPMRSLAVDQSVVPLAAPVFTVLPDAVPPVAALGFALDVSAKPATAQLFFGWGTQAVTRADALHSAGHLYLLLPRPTAPAA